MTMTLSKANTSTNKTDGARHKLYVLKGKVVSELPAGRNYAPFIVKPNEYIRPVYSEIPISSRIEFRDNHCCVLGYDKEEELIILKLLTPDSLTCYYER